MSDEIFGVYEDDLFEEVEIVRATKQEKQELYEFLGGFHKWEELDTPLQMHVIGYLSYWDRCNLSLCSKDNNRLVNESVLVASEGVRQKDGGIRMKPKNLAALCRSDYEQEQSVVEIESIELDKLFIEVQTFSGMTRSWKFTQNLGSCTVKSKSSMPSVITCTRIHVIENGNAQSEFVKKVQKSMENAKNSLRILRVLLNWNLSELPEKLPNLKSLEFSRGPSEETQFWLSKLSSETVLENFSFLRSDWGYRENPQSFDALALPTIINSKTLRLDSQIHISDEQFLDLKATKLIISTDTISNGAIEEYIRRWVDDIGNDFKHCIIYFSYNSQRPRIEFTRFDSTEYDIWNPPSRYRKFFENFRRYSNGLFYQVPKRNDPFNSVSVFVRDMRIMIIRTGFPCIRNGRPDTDLIFPEYLSKYWLIPKIKELSLYLRN